MSATIDQVKACLAGRYDIEREVGRGGMATVYLARDVRNHRDVALKILHSELTHAIGPERFLREIEIAAGLRHPARPSAVRFGRSGRRTVLRHAVRRG
ncbi:MAG: protein kinase domain-containing protein [Longimicrobiales bacterium]